ncbi:hypothetical protein GCM10028778_10640 [Barrientosiimonas marina]|uniref:Flagellar brake protein n=1 Tax=Lentibacillus kimchii TaxID=1542911 RepID=A0ABW2UY72_9BACI
MEIGTSLTLEAINPETNETQTCRSRIIDQQANKLMIDLPIDDQSSQTMIYAEGTSFKVTYIGADKNVHMFDTTLVSKINDNPPALAVRRPEDASIKTVQRRQFIRVNTAVDAAIHGTNNSFTTVTSDLSGGGMAVIVPQHQRFDIGEEVAVWMVLPMNAGDYHYIHALSEVTRLDLDKDIRKISLKFTSLKQDDQQTIIRFCFEKQLDARKKELT